LSELYFLVHLSQSIAVIVLKSLKYQLDITLTKDLDVIYI